MLLGPPPPRADSRCLWWDEPRWVVLRRSPATQAVLVAIVVAAFFYRRRVAVDARGIWLMPAPPCSWLAPWLGFFSVAGMRQSSRAEITGVRIVDHPVNRPAEMIVSRKYAKPYAVVVAPSVQLTTLWEALQEFGIVTEWDSVLPQP